MLQVGKYSPDQPRDEEGKKADLPDIETGSVGYPPAQRFVTAPGDLSGVTKAFNPAQPRDEQGRWTDDGSRFDPNANYAGLTKVTSPISKDEALAVRQYVASDKTATIQNALRRGIEPRGANKARIEGIDAALAKSVSAKDFVAYRGINSIAWQELALTAQLTNTLSDPGFMSTSLDSNFVSKFAGEGGGTLHIQVPAGQPALAITAGRFKPKVWRAEGGRTYGAVNLANEREVLLPRAARLQVVSIDRDARVAVLRVVPAAQKAFDPNQPRDDHGRWSETGVSDLSEGEKEAVRAYSRMAGSYLDINRKLRAGASLEGDSLVAALDKFARSDVAAKDFEVYRVLSPGMLSDLAPGSVLQDAGFMSTSATLDGIESVMPFLMEPGAKPTLMRIKVPQGARYGSVANLTATPNWRSSEEELLFPRGSRLRFTGEQGTTNLYGKVIPTYVFALEQNLGKVYDPNQPRDEEGKWTESGAGPGLGEAFHRWFAGSKVVDKQGQPLVVYHYGSFNAEEGDIPSEGMHFGTQEAAEYRSGSKVIDDQLQALTTYQGDSEDEWYWDDGAGFTSEEVDPPYSSAAEAKAAGERWIINQNENNGGYDDDNGTLTAAYLSIKNPMRWADQGKDWSVAIAEAKAKGHDGIVYRNEFEDKGARADSWIAFSPAQIKSVNATDFDPNNPDILKRPNPFEQDPSVDRFIESGDGLIVERPGVEKFDPDQPRDEQGRWSDVAEQGVPLTQTDEADEGEQGAVARYTANNHVFINRYLRKQNNQSGENYIEDITSLDSFVTKAQFKQDGFVYRVVNRGGSAGKLYRDLKPGDVITDLGYGSVAMNRAGIERFAGQRKVGHGLMKIAVTKGQRIGPVVRYSLIPDEGELLLPRGSRMRFDGPGPNGSYNFTLLGDMGKAYDPNQPRDEEGKWTESGAFLARAASDREAWPDHIKALGIPPAWTDVHYNQDPEGDLLAIGTDAKGRAQYVYSERFAQGQAEAKFERIREMREKYTAIARENLKNETSPDVRQAEHAQVTSVIMATGIRPGSTQETRGEVQAYGATTLEGRHVLVKGGGVTLSFVGKSGVTLSIPVTDSHAASILRRRSRSAGPNSKLFPNISASSLRDYVHTLDGGGFKTKDFRTALGTMTAMSAMAKMAKPATKAAYKKSVRTVAKLVSTRLGNTPTVALQSYIDPTVWAKWRASSGFAKAFDPNQPRDDHGRWSETGGLSAKLADLGGPSEIIAAEQMKNDPDVQTILSKGKLFDASAPPVLGTDGECHWNTGKLYAEGAIDAVVIGYAQNREGWHQHTWGLKDGKVVETTPSNVSNTRYFGLPLDKAASKRFAEFVAKPENAPGNGNVRTLQGGKLAKLDWAGLRALGKEGNGASVN